ncbi:hypothetical protein [Thalassospira lohafexi]|uniref:Uncharacterized protein n=1 Tax=Thalassospira lohafexi TaxID=744227 RepID=A0A2N3L3V8_9PROT|nr:hypothetical protein [Thalassospira lohafexi]PKR57512.1 hypothetical protein COO92_16355 [Thalassospira lohafexi]
MAQHDYVAANGSGAVYRGDVNDVLLAVATMNSGATAPSTTYAYMPYVNTSDGHLYQRNAANTAWVDHGLVASPMLRQSDFASQGEAEAGTANNKVMTPERVAEFYAANGATESFVIAVSDEQSDLSTGTGKVTFRMPYAFTLTGVRASVSTAPTGAALTVDVNEAGTSVLSTKLTIDAGEKTSITAATPAVISDASLADDSEMTIDIDAVGSTIAGAGLKIVLIGARS